MQEKDIRKDIFGREESLERRLVLSRWKLQTITSEIKTGITELSGLLNDVVEAALRRMRIFAKQKPLGCGGRHLKDIFLNEKEFCCLRILIWKTNFLTIKFYNKIITRSK